MVSRLGWLASLMVMGVGFSVYSNWLLFRSGSDFVMVCFLLPPVVGSMVLCVLFVCGCIELLYVSF